MGLVFILAPIMVFAATSSQNQNMTIVVSSTPPADHCIDGMQNFDETGVDCGGSTCSSCGGGGGGGGAVLAQVSFNGKAAPYGSIKILKDGILASTGAATASGDFNIVAGNLSTGNYKFTIYYEDSAGRRSASLIINTSINQRGQAVIFSNILLSPTLDTNMKEVKRGESITIFGEATPGADITIRITAGNGSELIYHTTALSNGNYQFVLNTSAMALGQYSIRVRSALGTTMLSEYTSPITFTVSEKSIMEPQEKCPTKGDLNNDCRVNLVDFSIAAYWYHRQMSPSFFAIEARKLNGDGIISLVDFSILAYYWTG
ncbi:MAG: hypothetical protein NTW66_01100 [Candidatus Magasanikbacteria bacterium]|nr:hypothetical protein [Candidatus Magasanikbacteria bacterium]